MRIISSKKRKKGSINSRIMGRMLIIVFFSFVLIIGAYTFISLQSLYLRARQSMESYQEDPEFYLYDRSGTLFYVYEYQVVDPELVQYVNLESADLENMDLENGSVIYYIDGEEEGIANYYLNHKNQLIYDNYYHYGDISYDAVFMLTEEPFWPENMRDAAKNYLVNVIYCDLSYYASQLRSNILLFLVIAAVIITVLFLVSRYTVRMLDRKDTGMKNFFANASHELKTPLMSIRGNVDGIRSGYVPTTEGCEIIEREVERMSDLISGILDISKLDSGTIKPDLIENDVREILYDAATSLMPEMEKRGLQLELDLPDPIFFPCDESLFYSAFSNILSNALRYADHCIRVRAQSSKDGKTLIQFENDGNPITEEDMRHIFDRFYKGTGGQSGIGMALAQEYMKLHNREIKVQVVDGKSVFSVLL